MPTPLLLEQDLETDVQNIPNYAVRVETCFARRLESGDVRITGTVINTGLTRLQTPYLYFTVHDRFGTLLREEVTAAGVKFIQGGEEIAIEVLIPDCSTSAALVRVLAST
ncbi:MULTISPECIES: hypothetical protein [Chloracidobacterium]|jgi:hypothetical protein|uniref:Uncharacterized protein n=1 Tax=Chloracidobacterium thermophilum (strain B) TaxID=981222 RepID=G2LEQ8_CHLTF|nr:MULTISPECIES: hypothetical protein [Chloracidobacterium]AEP12041.1 hypothetical protein Cabther_A1289 [Chloracidobacterium thermophilum B]QUV77790.1 hypothetical protein J8C08_06525 [Chloracidobacterium thermophilum]QUV80853.1 hypothetical protein J8C01_06265 [Chloracidobacterium sp. D]